MSGSNDPGPVVVGVDFSKQNAPAVACAAAEAVAHHVPLVLMHALDPHVVVPTYLALSTAELAQDAQSELADQAAVLLAEHPGLNVRTAVVEMSATDALVEASRGATLVVLGSRGHGEFSQLMLGAVAWRVVSRAVGPVLLVRPDESTASASAGPVLVAVDGSPGSAATVDFALEEARSRGQGLVAVTVWALPHPEGLSIGRTWSHDASQWETEMEDDARRVLAETLAGREQQYPDVEITQVVIHGLNVPQALLEVAAAHNAALVVVGAHGHNPFSELVLGAVGVQLVHQADRSLAVVHSQAVQS